MINVDLQRFGKAIRETYPGYNEETSVRQAKLWAERLDVAVEEAVKCWIAGEAIPDIAYTAPNGETFSIERIIAVRGENDYLRAMLLLSDFINDPKRGRNRILSPRR